MHVIYKVSLGAKAYFNYSYTSKTTYKTHFLAKIHHPGSSSLPDLKVLVAGSPDKHLVLQHRAHQPEAGTEVIDEDVSDSAGSAVKEAPSTTVEEEEDVKSEEDSSAERDVSGFEYVFCRNFSG